MRWALRRNFAACFRASDRVARTGRDSPSTPVPLSCRKVRRMIRVVVVQFGDGLKIFPYPRSGMV
jgi:hypothetical protein